MFYDLPLPSQMFPYSKWYRCSPISFHRYYTWGLLFFFKLKWSCYSEVFSTIWHPLTPLSETTPIQQVFSQGTAVGWGRQLTHSSGQETRREQLSTAIQGQSPHGSLGSRCSSCCWWCSSSSSSTCSSALLWSSWSSPSTWWWTWGGGGSSSCSCASFLSSVSAWPCSKPTTTAPFLPSSPVLCRETGLSMAFGGTAADLSTSNMFPLPWSPSKLLPETGRSSEEGW